MSSWRDNREVVGWGGNPIIVTGFIDGPVDYVCVLNPPVSTSGGLATHLVFETPTATGRRIIFSDLLVGFLRPLTTAVRARTFKPGDVWPVLPD